jgi:hypothetical protein
MDFCKWLEINEARGAFGKMNSQDKARRDWEARQSQNYPNAGTHAPNTSTGPQIQPQRHDNRFQNKDQRVQYGKGIEKQIFDSLVACGLKLRPASEQEDMYDKIDGWWNTGTGEQPIQIKYRDTGNDILFEVLKDYDRGIPGRDMIGKAVYYAVLINGQISIVQVAEAKQLIQQAVKMGQQRGLETGDFVMSNGLTLKVRPDPRSGQNKLMAYVPVKLLKNVKPPCKANVAF